MAKKKEKDMATKKTEEPVVVELVTPDKKNERSASAWRLALYGVGLCLWVVGVSIAVQLLVGLFIGHVLMRHGIILESAIDTPAFMSAYQAVVYVISLAISILLPWKVLHAKVTRNEIGLEGLPTWTEVLLAPIGLMLSLILGGVLLMVCEKLIPGVDWGQEQDVGFNVLASSSDYVLAFVSLVIVAPICEELIFRGWIYAKLRARMKALPAIFLVSLAFGVAHLQWNVGVTVFVMSVFMCLLRELTGTIYSGILVHMLKNGLAFYVLYAAVPFLHY